MAQRRPLLNVFLRLGFAPALALLLAVAAFLVEAPELVTAAGTGCVTPGNDGPNAALTGIVNSYYPATASAALGATAISVGARFPAVSPPIAAGDLLLVIQMQDADIQGTNAITYGDGATGRGSTGLRSTGLYEYVAATSAVVAGTVNIAGTGGGAGLVNSYDFLATVTATHGFRTFQVIRVPQYSSATVTAGLTAAAWDGTAHAGGVLAIDVAGGLNLNGQTINVDQLGFKGGLGASQAGAAGGTGTDYVVPSLSGFHGYKAEGIGGTPRFLYDAIAGAAVNGAVDGYPTGDAARGAPGNAGGGGTDADPVANDQNTGGGGGANGGQGGTGGDSWFSAQPVGGLGGAAFPALATRVVLGGGGGAGSRNNSAGLASSGGTGGGIVMIRAGSLTGAGVITADGGVGVTPANDGGGGGGAGGSVVVSITTGTVNGLTIAANGGNGTDANAAGTPGTAERHGPGGGGAGGVIVTSNALPLAQTSVVGGVHGLTTNGPDPYGSTSGAGGLILTTTAGTILGSSSGAECLPVLTTAKSTSTPTVINTASGTTATYAITVSNAAGVAPANAVGISDALPAGFTYASTGGVVLSGGATRTAVINPGLGDATPAFGTFSIPAGGSVAITFTVNVASSVAPGTYNNPATAIYLDAARTTALGTTSAGYAGGGAERVTVLPGLPNTSGLPAAAGTDGPTAAHGRSGVWFALVTLIIGVGALGLAAIALIAGRARTGQSRAPLAMGMLAGLVCFVLGPPAVGQFTAQPADQPAWSSPGLSTSESVFHRPTAAPDLIGNALVTTEPPAQVAPPSFHLASGPITPARLRIPSINVDARVDGAGILPDGSMGVPASLWTSTWLSTGPHPGQAGSVVIAGHRGIGAPALFSHLENVQPGDRVYVSDAAGGEVVYEVTRVASLDLSAATQIVVFGPTAQQQLVLITCFGAYSSHTQTYDHRLVVFSRLLPPNA